MSEGKSVVLSTGHKMPATGYGTWQSKPGEVRVGIYEALKIGYRHLDLAKIYENQLEAGKAIAQALADIPGLKREDIFITSKLWNHKHRPENVEAALDDTLAELGLDYLDLYLIHWPVAFIDGDALYPRTPDSPYVVLDNGVSLSQTWKAMTELPKSKVRAVGVSNFSIKHIETIIKDTDVVPAVNQIERHPRIPNYPLIDYCRSKNIIITAYSTFGNNSRGIPLLVNQDEVKAIAQRFSERRRAKGETDVTPAQLTLAWSRNGGHSVIPKSVTVSRIAENFLEIDLDAQAKEELDKFGESNERFNIPFNYTLPWNINIFDTKVEQGANAVVLKV